MPTQEENKIKAIIKIQLQQAYKIGWQNGTDNVTTMPSLEDRVEIIFKEFSTLLSKEKQWKDEMAGKIEEVISKHNARILNEFQKQGTPDMPFIAYDERICLIPAMRIATDETLSLLSNNKSNGN